LGKHDAAPTWEVYWQSRFQNMALLGKSDEKTRQEIDYIVTRRHEFRLPEIRWSWPGAKKE